jgi:alpha-tubulin suppressor-like RCC1 family protein
MSPMRLGAALALVAATLLAAASCDLGSVPFACTEDAACAVETTAGACEPSGFCSFPDEACESGRRYGEHATDALSNACVESCVADITLGAAHGCLRTKSGEVHCWGDATTGNLGPGKTGPSGVTRVEALSDVRAIAAGAGHTCAIVGDAARLVCWGDGSEGQVGAAGSGLHPPTEVQVDGQPLAPVQAIALGRAHTCAAVATSGGELFCWGSDASGQLGTGAGVTSGSEPVSVARSVAGLEWLALGGNSSCARAGGFAACWGDNACGQLALVDADSYAEPTASAMVALSGVVVGRTFACGMTGLAEDPLHCWGYVSKSACGTKRETPSELEGTKRPLPLQLAAGDHHACALWEDGGVSCWGAADEGQLGPTVDVAQPDNWINIDVEDVVQIAAGGDTACALTKAGRVFCWGANDRAQLGSGSASPPASQEPVEWVSDALVCP